MKVRVCFWDSVRTPEDFVWNGQIENFIVVEKDGKEIWFNVRYIHRLEFNPKEPNHE
jgi:hypothetical protein